MQKGPRGGHDKWLARLERRLNVDIRATCLNRKTGFTIVLALAGLIPLFSWAVRVKPDPEVERLLRSPSVVEAARSDRVKTSHADGKDSPLVVQAEVFARLISPPKAVVKETAAPPPAPRPPQSSPKFTVVATSVYPGRPDLSRALVSEPSGILRWVKPGDALEHLVIEEIRSGLVVYRDGTRLGEIAVDTGSPATTSPIRTSPETVPPSLGHADASEPRPFVRVVAGIEPHGTSLSRQESTVKPRPAGLANTETHGPLGHGGQQKKDHPNP